MPFITNPLPSKTWGPAGMVPGAQRALQKHTESVGTAHALSPGVESTNARVFTESETDLTGCVNIWEQK